MAVKEKGRKTPAPEFPLSRILEKKGVSLAWLADKSGVGYTTLASLARGDSRPDWGTLVKVAAALQLPLCYFTPSPSKETKHVGFE